jgi:hypothetical protein
MDKLQSGNVRKCSHCAEIIKIEQWHAPLTFMRRELNRGEGHHDVRIRCTRGHLCWIRRVTTVRSGSSRAEDRIRQLVEVNRDCIAHERRVAKQALFETVQALCASGKTVSCIVREKGGGG